MFCERDDCWASDKRDWSVDAGPNRAYNYAVPQWRIIRGQPPSELYGGEVIAIVDAPTGNAAIE